MHRAIDDYKHLDETDPLSINLTMEEVAELVIMKNYGVHRLLSSIVRIRLANDPDNELALELKKLLNKGLF